MPAAAATAPVRACSRVSVVGRDLRLAAAAAIPVVEAVEGAAMADVNLAAARPAGRVVRPAERGAAFMTVAMEPRFMAEAGAVRTANVM